MAPGVPLDVSSENFYTHHWIKPHHTNFPHESGWFAKPTPNFSTAMAAVSGNMNQMSHALQLRLARKGLLYQDTDPLQSNVKIPGSKWVCGESV
mmetsp:Transcript_19424/g.39616  ORF Transcript_19424/g.39616 Transcript_19424/m.39616 type:complete len:94 (-) Transcript_19424:108-389(-)|eukprot:CAMPEP_0181299406 /NCGR_PEP_ID=MMETSP1101-20121128/6326_1 /TAXON_ID=46948 /ORGANISM="Rhodomonas abbreviata, Strain Caron Lab Isolate" /LENGTH=93 /DNA_ID=CAMNT_0023404547 /DNA_START=105 /DNA_END=386 /DNA_ORIENTATION=+